MALNKVEICGVNTSSLPILKSDEKEALFQKIKKGDSEAREQYIKGNLRLVLSVIKRFQNSNENADDLFQIGCIGLMKAVDNFDDTLNVKFSTYAVPTAFRSVCSYSAYISAILCTFHAVITPAFPSLEAPGHSCICLRSVALSVVVCPAAVLLELVPFPPCRKLLLQRISSWHLCRSDY